LSTGSALVSPLGHITGPLRFRNRRLRFEPCGTSRTWWATTVHWAAS